MSSPLTGAKPVLPNKGRGRHACTHVLGRPFSSWSEDETLGQGSAHHLFFLQKTDTCTQELRKLQHANAGKPEAFSHILDLAYGRKGKLRRELIEPLLTDPKVPVPLRIIPAVEKSRPPIYTAELGALLTNSYSRTTKPLSAKVLKTPPTLPTRADPSSEEARFLGPFSKRREVNIRWRYFTSEWKKVRPPLYVTVQHRTESSGKEPSMRDIGFQDPKILDDIITLVGSTPTSTTRTRKERLSVGVSAHESTEAVTFTHPSRWIRRRYQNLLTRLPTLSYSPSAASKGKGGGSYSVELTTVGLGATSPNHPYRFSEVDSTGITWCTSTQKPD
ncbi:hypothetical protein BDQ12DRAFT_724710 [Crucibulum laeve]|uniref:LYR motif-containing protein Cup1-like N-terminal domain-containing protein n=1 Tax=Crucibulum laeve TaxID=68775 RepID=A0A5C3LVP4_9AGAR|nr:hypothetical protein BDQ12DRAFT_724710 [Crucibulum laeve]